MKKWKSNPFVIKALESALSAVVFITISQITVHAAPTLFVAPKTVTIESTTKLP